MQFPISTAKAWEVFQALPDGRMQVIRRVAAAELSEMYAGTDEGIGSSDINHHAVAMISCGDVPSAFLE